MAKTDIDIEVNLVLKFFSALGIDDDEEALLLFKSAFFDPSRRVTAQDFLFSIIL